MELPEWKKGLNIGQEVRVVSIEPSNGFSMGDIARVVDLCGMEDTIICEHLDGSDYWYLQAHELTTKPSFSFEAVAQADSIDTYLSTDGILMTFDNEPHSAFTINPNKRYKVTVEEV